jgi:hypothetical protein
MLRGMDRTPVKLQLTRHASATADRMLAKHHAVLRGLDGKRTQIKELVVK